MRKVLLIAALCGAPAAASACPDWSLGGAELAYAGAQVFTPQSVAVIAGGDQDLAACALPGVRGQTGRVMSQPDFTVTLVRMGDYSAVEFRVDSECDSVLLVNTAGGDWVYDDDGAGNLDARVRLSKPADGQYDVWIGTFDGAYCDAQLIVESF
jgi:hypothetical protein